MKPIRIRHLFKTIRTIINDKKILSYENILQIPKTILIVKLDAIGDYLLFRNFLEDIRKSKKFGNYKITLCGNSIWKELAEKLDAVNVDEFIWVEKNKFINDEQYRNGILLSIKKKGFEIAFQPTFSKEILTGDSIIRASFAKYKIGSFGDDANENIFFKRIGDSFYTKLLNKNSDSIFEFEKNKLIIEELIEEKINRIHPEIENLNYNKKENKFAILFPGAGELQKQWPIENFARIADEISSKYNFEIRICGSKSDSFFAEQLISFCKKAQPQNLCGKTKLHELIDQIANAEILITNDSSALHIAGCTNTKTVCVLNGRHYGRFAPYPNLIAPNLKFVFPDKMEKLRMKNPKVAIEKTKFNAIQNIKTIEINKVMRSINDILK